MVLFDFFRKRREKKLEKSVLQQKVDDWLNSEDYKMLLSAENYYRVRNDIVKRKRMVIGKDGILVEAKNIADNRIPHAYLRDLADQKVQYLLGNDWSFETESNEYQNILDDFFTDELKKTIYRTAKDAIIKRAGWLYVYVNENGLQFKRMQPEEIIPDWVGIDHTTLNGVIRVYSQTEYTLKGKETKRYVDEYTTNGISHYSYTDGKLTFLSSESYMSNEKTSLNWLKIPFIPVKYNDEEISLFETVKALIDEYDRAVSDDANLLEDEPNGFKVVKNAQGSNASEIVKNLSVYRTVLIGENGDFDIKTTTPNIDASVKHLESLHKNIYNFGRGVDTNADIGANASAQARQYLYAKLDLDCNQLEDGVISALNEMLWFFNNNPNKQLPYENEKVKFVFSRNMMINESQILDNAIKMQQIAGISMETVVASVPGIDDAVEEIEKWKAEDEPQVIDNEV